MFYSHKINFMFYKLGTYIWYSMLDVDTLRHYLKLNMLKFVYYN